MKASPYGWLMLAGIVVSAIYWARHARRDDRLLAVYVAGLAGAFLGAKVAYLLAEGWADWGKPDMWLRLATGKSILGALPGGYGGVELAKRLLGYREVTGDRFAAIAPVGIVLGRLGCLAHGCCLGRVCAPTWYAWVDSAGTPRWPAVLVEIGFNGVAWVLFAMWRRAGTLTGQHFHIYLMAYGVFRFVHETQRETLRKHSDAAIRERAQLLFAAAETGDRMKAYEKARSVLTLTGNAANGHKTFATHCTSCHRLDREGHNVGPDLLGIRNQPKESILLHIVHPNYEVVAGFNACTVECKDGRELTGLIIGESPASVTLRQAQGIEETIPRSGINKLTVGQVSLMPEGLETAMSQQELADLLACLKGE